jgi:SpoVK/Ycf46/Vps4 family AAA+-type ATPase
MDGVSAKKSVFFIGATNRPEILDEAIIRPVINIYYNFYFREDLINLFIFLYLMNLQDSMY